jgi:FAD/FMN-containing dehydrogenase
MTMSDVIGGTLNRLGQQLLGCRSMPGEERFATATAIWAKPVGRMPWAVAHCRTSDDVWLAIRAVRDCDLPLSVRGGHDWAGRALCDGIVIDLSGMNNVVVDLNQRAPRISGGPASQTFAVADPLGVAPDPRVSDR